MAVTLRRKEIDPYATTPFRRCVRTRSGRKEVDPYATCANDRCRATRARRVRDEGAAAAAAALRRLADRWRPAAAAATDEQVRIKRWRGAQGSRLYGTTRM